MILLLRQEVARQCVAAWTSHTHRIGDVRGVLRTAHGLSLFPFVFPASGHYLPTQWPEHSRRNHLGLSGILLKPSHACGISEAV